MKSVPVAQMVRALECKVTTVRSINSSGMLIKVHTWMLCPGWQCGLWVCFAFTPVCVNREKRSFIQEMFRCYLYLIASYTQATQQIPVSKGLKEGMELLRGDGHGAPHLKGVHIIHSFFENIKMTFML